jgi:hypothetical protein
MWLVYKSDGFVAFKMESTQPIRLSSILSEGYKYFEVTHEQYPDEAKQVFSRVADLCAALQAFKEATLGAKNREEGVEAAPEIAESAALLAASEGSVEVETPAIGVVG